MSTTTAPSTPNSLFHTPSLPPTARDFEIHRLALVDLLSTYRIADKFRISQTRVRQIIARVAEWMTEMLPIKSEQDIEKEKNYAIHLAAAQLQNQIEHLKYSWDASSDPKYYRQMTRTILALARLGVSAHHLDALADKTSPSDPETQEAEPALHSPAAAPSSFSLHPSEYPSPPPPGACSPPAPQASSPKPQAFSTPDETSNPVNYLRRTMTQNEDTLKGFKIFEQRLLTLIDQTYPEQTQRLHDLQETLAEVRQEQANFILQLGPNHPVLAAQSQSDQSSSGPLAPTEDKVTLHPDNA